MNNLAVVAHAAEDLRIEDIGAPAPRPDEAVVDIAYGGICGSDLHYCRHGAAGASVLRWPLIHALRWVRRGVTGDREETAREEGRS